MNPLERLEFYKDNYTNTELLIYEWAKQNLDVIVRLPIESIAEKTNTSKAAIIRFSKKIGYQGFAEFKFELSRFIISGERLDKNDDDMDTITSITSLYEGYLRQFSTTLNLNQIKNAAKQIIDANRIKLIGNNRSGLPAIQMRHRLSKIGVDAEAVTDMVLVRVLQDIIKKNDVIVIFSTVGNDPLYINFAKNVKDSGAIVYLVTTNQKNKLSKYCEDTFYIPSISQASSLSFLDDQALFFVFVEILLTEIAYKIKG